MYILAHFTCLPRIMTIRICSTIFRESVLSRKAWNYIGINTRVWSCSLKDQISTQIRLRLLLGLVCWINVLSDSKLLFFLQMYKNILLIGLENQTGLILQICFKYLLISYGCSELHHWFSSVQSQPAHILLYNKAELDSDFFKKLLSDRIEFI